MQIKVTCKVIGLRTHRYVETYEDTDYETCHDETYEDILVVKIIEENGRVPFSDRFVEMHFWTENAPCGSGYCMSTYGHYEAKWIDRPGPMSARPKQELIFKAILDDEEYQPMLAPFGVDNYDELDEGFEFLDSSDGLQIASVSYDGGDHYYPSGHSLVNRSLFTELPRAMDKRPVWIFNGKSGLGKSSIAWLFRKSEVFETDSVDKLPEEIYANIVVLGNRSGFTIEDVKSRLFGDPKVILVSFEEDADA